MLVPQRMLITPVSYVTLWQKCLGKIVKIFNFSVTVVIYRFKITSKRFAQRQKTLLTRQDITRGGSCNGTFGIKIMNCLYIMKAVKPVEISCLK